MDDMDFMDEEEGWEMRNYEGGIMKEGERSLRGWALAAL
jgi:hypothetical protein